MRHFIIRVATAVALSTVATAAGAAVYSPQQQLPTTIVDSFKSNPSDLLTQYPRGGAQLISRVRDLVASDPTTLSSVIGLIKSADKTQLENILAGLAQAAYLASKSDTKFYTEIQDAIAQNTPKSVQDRFAELTNNVATGAGAGGGGGGGAGGGGSGAGGQTGSSGAAFGGNNGGANTFGGLHYANTQTGPISGSVGSPGSSVSPR